jgi:hypothetical protein
MCTLSLLRLRRGYSLMFNRDESPRRAAARDFAGLADGAGAPWALFPVDPPSGGTFVGTNRAGASYAILNQHPAAYTRPEGAQSRGRLIPLALAEGQAIRGLEAVAQQDLSRTPPFLLVGVDEGEAPVSLRWDGVELQRRLHGDGAYQTASSARFAERALPLRRRLFDAMLQRLPELDDAAILAAQEAYHLSPEPDETVAVWMRREEARSVSLSHVLVLPEFTVLRHWPREDREAARPPLQHTLVRTKEG